MNHIRNYLIAFMGNVTFTYFIFAEGTLNKPLMFATLMLLLMMGMDFIKSRTTHSLNKIP
ncbi:hypothetical protein [Paenibacillus sp. 7516]|uniref:hypothetical protein n=1 Tax=Paenibacillus sp. 7516 TaxID=2022549 RepID=UPI000BA5D3B6|nr:hypothetical protein [Paenibacillus sp. 7516]PAF30385.1 hypothetical protein CHI14_16640 [Paenibacillus sp. 7516]